MRRNVRIAEMRFHSMANKVVLSNIDYNTIEHKEDLSIRKKLDAIPKFKSFMMNTICALREKYISIEFAGNGIHVTQECLPDLHTQLMNVCKTIGYESVPDFSLMWNYYITAGTEGANNPHITTMSGAIDLLNEDELSFLLGHEIGHQACGHKPYHMFLETLYMPLINIVPGGKIWIGLVRSTLLNWYRYSDFTADRIGLLACQDINAALTTMIKMSGMPKKYFSSINVDSFIKQSQEFDEMYSGITGNIINYVSINTAFNPWLVARAAELYRWYKSGDYEHIINSNR